MRIIRLSFANLKKKKSLAATLILLTFLSVLFLNMGLILSSSSSAAFAKRSAQLMSPDLFIVTATDKFQNSFETFLENDSRVDFVEKEEVIYMESTRNSVNTLKTGAVIFNSERDRSIEPLHLLSSDPSVPEESAIYLPTFLENSGASLGDDFTLTFKNTEYHFQIAGFFETAYMGTNGYGYLKYFVSDNGFQKLYESAGTGRTLSVRLQDGLPKSEASLELQDDFLSSTDYYTKVGGLLVSATCISIYSMQENTLSTLSVPLGIMVSLASIVGIITFIMIYFKVKEDIDDTMVNIGSLQAMGYTSVQIILSKQTEFIILGLTGGITGIIATYLILPFNEQFSAGMVGLSLKPIFDFSLNLISLLIVLFLILCSSLFAALKIRKITPVTAFRKGVKTHHFGKNFLPLQNGNGSLYLRLALKNMLAGIKQNIITIIIIAMGTFSICLAVIFYANFGYDTSALMKMTGIEIADIQITPLPHVNLPAFMNELEAMEEVRKVNQSESYMAKINNMDINFTVSDHFDKTETLSLSQGTYPVYDNEAVLSSLLLTKLNKKIGDSVAVTSKGITREYLITGTSLATNNSSMMGLLSLDGVKRMDPEYKLTNIDLYLKNPGVTQEFTDQLYRLYGITSESSAGLSDQNDSAPDTSYEAAKKRAASEIRRMLDQYGMDSVEYAVMLNGELILSGDSSTYKIKEISSLTEYLNGQLASYAVMMKGLVMVILLVMLLIMGTIISITIHSLLRRQKEEFGIYKAIGYTTGDLIKIISLNFIVNAAAGSLLGSLTCVMFGSSIITLFFRSMGLDLGALITSTGLMAMIAAGIVIFIGIISVLRACQVKKITVYELLTE